MKLLDRALEAVLIDLRRLDPRFPPTFVVGAPRSGTTLVGLHLHRCFRFAYLANVAKREPRAPFVATRRALERGVTWEPDYENRYGEAEGDLAPSDGWDVLLRFFPGYVVAVEGHATRARPLRTLVSRLEQLFGAPFVCKNNQNTMRIAALAALFPEALFVHVRRALPEATASLLEARARHRVPAGGWWSAAPPNHLERAFESELELVVTTLVDLDQHARETLARAAPGRHLVVDYESFCHRPAELTDWLERAHAERGSRLERRPGPIPERFEASRLAPARRAELEERIGPVLERLHPPSEASV